MDRAIAEERASVPPVFYIEGIPHNDNGDVQGGDALSISSGRGKLYYTLDGSDPRLPGGTEGTEFLSHILVPEEAPKKILIPSGPISDAWKGGEFFNDRSWMLGAGKIGYGTGPGFRDLIDTDLTKQVNQGQTSLYTRIGFRNDIQDMNLFDTMILKIRYDDGFVAYLNGVEVGRANAPLSPQWNAMATAENPDEAATYFEGFGAAYYLQDFDISSHLNVLKQGANVLAIQGLNITPSDSDFLISAELVIEERELDSDSDYGISPTAHEYIDPMTLTKSVTVKARALSADGWSALNKATYAVGPVAENLFVTMVAYPARHDSDEAFVELTNMGVQTINLNGVKFTEGIDFTFPSIELAPGEHIVVVRDREAFQAKHGTEANIAGQYTARLNPSEEIRLVDAIGRTIHDFTTKDD